MGLKEKAVASVLAMVVLYVAAVAMWFLHSEAAWKKAASKYEAACRTYQKQVETIANKARYEEDYERAKSLLPSFDANMAADTTWRDKMRSIASKNLVIVSDDAAESEIVKEDVQVLPIKVGAWEASLEALVKFLYELENTDEGMFDITELNMRPNPSKKGYLRGSFTLHCAYMRE